MNFKFFSFLLILFSFLQLQAQKKQNHTFTTDSINFLLDGKPFQIISGEIHYARVPHEYWKHRIQMAKAMGCNTIATYVFWNYHEVKEGIFDFETENRNLAKFLQEAKDENTGIAAAGTLCLRRVGPRRHSAVFTFCSRH